MKLYVVDNNLRNKGMRLFLEKAFQSWLFFSASFFLFYNFTYAQFNDEKRFGKNRVQYKKRIWSYITTPNFVIFYHDSKYDLARITARYAELDYEKVSASVGYRLYNKIKIMVYGSVSDLHQSNIGINQQNYKVGGQTEFIHSLIEIPFTGNKSTYRKELSRSLADILIFKMIYGSSFKEIIQSTYLLNLPEWFLSGASAYIGYGWNEKGDDFTRNLISKDNIHNIYLIEGEGAKKIGQSIWNYIVEKYGNISMANILNRTRINKNGQSAITSTLGISFSQFLADWKDYYTRQFNNIHTEYKTESFFEKIFIRNKNHLLNVLKYSPDGKYLAYSVNKSGRVNVIIRETETGKEKIIYRAGYKVINQPIDEFLPLISWVDSKVIGIFGTKRGEYSIFLHDVEKNKKNQLIDLVRFNHINGFDIANNKKSVVFSGERLGRSDIYLYNGRTKRIVRITNDEYDNIDPQFMPDNKQIVFSSNRTTSENLKNQRKINLEEIDDQFNLFMYDFRKPKKFLRLTNTFGKNIKPKPISQNEILFLSDRRGITQLFKYTTQDSLTIQVSNFFQSIKNYDTYQNELAIVSLDNKKENIYRFKDVNFNQNTFTKKTLRQEILDLRKVQEIRKERVQKEIKKEQSFPSSQLPDSLPKENSSEKYRFDTFSQQARKNLTKKFKRKLQKKKKTSTTSQKQLPSTSNTLTSSVRESTLSSKHENRFGIDNTISTLFIDPLIRSLGLHFEWQMSETMENHKINGGILEFFSNGNKSFFLEYWYLKKRIDYRFRFDRRNISITTSNSFRHAYALNKGSITFSYPFNLFLRASAEPFYVNTSFTNFSQISLGNSTQNYTGFNAELVFDNSIITGKNKIENTRMKARYEHYFHSSEKMKNFSSLTIDIRHYQPLLNYLTLASKLSYGKFFGASKKRFLLGGMENWINNERREHDEQDPITPSDEFTDISDVLFHRFITNLRGFEWNKIFGTDFLLFNGEIRLSISELFYNKTINSNFFRNLQFIVFTDIGTAWTGVSPFNRENALNTEIIDRRNSSNTGFYAVIQNFRNPFLMGYGFGLRTTLLGYYFKFDTAWGLEDNITSGPRYYFTIGHDF